MIYNLTSSEANKLLRKISERKELCLGSEEKSCIFNAALGEDVEDVRPEYDYDETQAIVDDCNKKIRIIKHAINVFNSTTMVGDTGFTVDEMLMVLPQLSEKRGKLLRMQNRLPKQRVSVAGMRGNNVIDYQYTNYDIDKVKEDYAKVGDLLREYQTALDVVNTTIKMEFELPE